MQRGGGHPETPLQLPQVDRPEVLVEESVEDGVHAGVGDQQPDDGEAQGPAPGDDHVGGAQQDPYYEDWERANLGGTGFIK